MNREDYIQRIQPRYSGYQELHVHSVGSYRDAVNEVTDIFDAAEELGRNAVAITDHGNWTRLFEALKERTKREKKLLKSCLSEIGASQKDIRDALKVMEDFDTVRNPSEKMWPFVERYAPAYVKTAQESIQYIPGIEMYECLPVEEDEHHWHIILLAKNWAGAQALFKLCNLAQLNKHNDMPRCTVDTLRFFLGQGGIGHGHVIATSACMGGKISDTLLMRYQLERKKDALMKSMDSVSVIHPDLMAAAKKNVVDAECAVQEASMVFAETKQVASKKYKAAISRAQKAYDKAVASMESSLSLTDGDQIFEAKKILDDVLAQAKLTEDAIAKLPAAKSAVQDAKARLKKTKEALTEMEKSNRPAIRLQERINALDDAICSEEYSDAYLYETAKRYAQEYETIFGKGNFYLELQDHGLEQDLILRNRLIRISKETGIPLTVANDVHYKNPEMKRKRDIVAALRFKGLTADEVASHPGNDQLYFKSNEQMMALFADVPEALENTNRIAEACNVFYTRELHLPVFTDTANGYSPAQYLRKMACKNVVAKYPDCKSWTKKQQQSFKERLEYELGIIEQMGYSSYIAIVEDFIRWAKEHYGPESVGPGRGSGAGSLVCYLVGITNIDPLKYGLIFERFLNPERVSMPKQYWAPIVNPITQGCAA